MTTHNSIEVSPVSYVLFHSRTSAPLWLLVRLYVGYEWLIAGWEKVVDPAWLGSSAGASLTGFIHGALAKTTGAHPSVQGWYASFLQGTVLPHVTVWSNLVAVGELLVGIGLIVGLFTGVAAFFGLFMNLNFMLAGTVSTNPVLFVLAFGLVLSRRVASYYGLDRYAPSLRRKFIPRKLRW